ncbi:MAG: hypothetical protein QXS19_05825 [Candidatus Methanomethylicia archaeon]
MEIVTDQEIEDIEKKIENRIETESRIKKRRKIDEDQPLELEKMSGREAVKILDYLHRKYLSWLREAEASKYVDIVRSIRSETLKEVDEFYNNIVKTYEDRITALEDTIMKLNETVKNLTDLISSVKEGGKVEVKHSETIDRILNDDRVKSLILIIYNILKKKIPELQEIEPIVLYSFLPEEYKRKLIESRREGHGGSEVSAESQDRES